MTAALQWGRMLRVNLTIAGGAFVELANYSSLAHRDQGLSCTITYTRHTMPEPQPSKIVVRNLAPALVATLYQTVAVAKGMSYLTKQALRIGRIQVFAGRNLIMMRRVVDDVIVNVYQQEVEGSADIETVIEAEDGRLLWDNLFIDTATPALNLTKLGSPPVPLPGPTLPTYTANGPQTIDTQAIIEALGFTPAQQGDITVWIPIGGTLALPPVILDTVTQPPLEPEGSNGERSANVLWNPEYMAGRAGLLQGRPYAMDEIQATLGTHGPSEWVASLSLRSTLPIE